MPRAGGGGRGGQGFPELTKAGHALLQHARAGEAYLMCIIEMASCTAPWRKGKSWVEDGRHRPEVGAVGCTNGGPVPAVALQCIFCTPSSILHTEAVLFNLSPSSQ